MKRKLISVAVLALAGCVAVVAQEKKKQEWKLLQKCRSYAYLYKNKSFPIIFPSNKMIHGNTEIVCNFNQIIDRWFITATLIV